MSYDKTDRYAGVASSIFGVPIGDVTEKQRNAAKTYLISRSSGASIGKSSELMFKVLEAKDIPRYVWIFQQIAKFFEKILKFLKKWLTPCEH